MQLKPITKAAQPSLKVHSSEAQLIAAREHQAPTPVVATAVTSQPFSRENRNPQPREYQPRRQQTQRHESNRQQSSSRPNYKSAPAQSASTHARHYGHPPLSSRVDENKLKIKGRRFLEFLLVAYRDNHRKPCRVARQVEITVVPFFNDCMFDPTILSGSGYRRVARRVVGCLSRSATGLNFQKIEFYAIETAGGGFIRFWTIRDDLGGD
ncbi:hypothetical protein E3N88_37678 [Mikania micrantha]|uniref:Uncharacterized protein n=1 Tax=Mikania micrantha TaxID=192012 RepID=A0A5N6LRW8_9ASTR|nr:hypothetical protein E3N88_37678 [Mikania micrantha]